MWLVNFSTYWRDKKSATMVFVEDLNTSPETDPKQSKLPTDTCRTLEVLMNNYGTDANAILALGGSEGGRFPVLTACPVKVGPIEDFSKYYYIGGLWVKWNDKEAIKELYKAATGNSSSVNWDEENKAANKLERNIQSEVAKLEDPNDFWTKKAIKNYNKVLNGTPYEVTAWDSPYRPSGLEGSCSYTIQDNVYNLADEVFASNYVPWKCRYEAVNRTHPEWIEILATHGIKSRKDYINRVEAYTNKNSVKAQISITYKDLNHEEFTPNEVIDTNELIERYISEIIAPIGQQ